MARRKTTKLIEPYITHGDHGLQSDRGNNVVTLANFGFTKMQWSRRTQELSGS